MSSGECVVPNRSPSYEQLLTPHLSFDPNDLARLQDRVKTWNGAAGLDGDQVCLPLVMNRLNAFFASRHYRNCV